MGSNQSQLNGSLLAARYAFMPNKLRYCGGDRDSEIFNYVAEDQSDKGLEMLLKEFATMYPYLKLIAEKNKILDPFNYRVVEAYWIGNELLDRITMNDFYRYMVDVQDLKKRFKINLLEKVFGKISQGAKPHHSWHVFNIPKRTGHYPVEHSLKTMDQCRIAPAKIKEWKQKTENNLASRLVVAYQPLVIVNNKLELGERIEKEVWSEIDDKVFIKQPKVGKWISIHWDWACDILTEDQVKNLEKWTKYNLQLANL